MKRTENFHEDRTRYFYDNSLLQLGYLQVDTKQDASWYGNWVNLKDRIYIQFAEGDETIIIFDSDEEMVTHLRRVYQLIHLDLGLSNRPAQEALARELGIWEICA